MRGTAIAVYVDGVRKILYSLCTDFSTRTKHGIMVAASGTPSKYATWDEYIVSRHSLSVVDHRVFYDGDSIVFGLGLTETTSLPYKITQAGNFYWLYDNVAGSGQTLADIIVSAQTDIDPNYDSAFSPIVVFDGGTNDLFYEIPPATIISQIQQYGNARKAVGFSAIYLGILPRSDASKPANFDANKATINNALLTDFSVASGTPNVWLPGGGIAYADAFIDWSSIAELSDSTNLTYYQDGLHPTAAAIAVAATYVAAAINEIG